MTASPPDVRRGSAAPAISNYSIFGYAAGPGSARTRGIRLPHPRSEASLSVEEILAGDCLRRSVGFDFGNRQGIEAGWDLCDGDYG